MLFLAYFIVFKANYYRKKMKESALIEVISTFSKAEVREFSRFMNSPFFNGRKDAARYWKSVKTFYPEFSSRKFTPENIFRNLYPGKKFDISELRRLSSYTLKMAEQYLAYKGLKNDTFFFDLSLSIQLSERGLLSRSQKQLKAADEKHSSKKGDYEFYFWKRYLIERHKNSLYSFTGDDHLAPQAIIKRTDMLSYHTAAVICKSLISLFINEKNFNADYSKSDFYVMVKSMDLEGFIGSLKEKDSEFYPVLAAEYYQAMALINSDNNEYFRKFKEVLLGGLGMFTFLEQINFYTIFEAVCTLKIEGGEQEYSKDLFEAYGTMLNKGLYSYSPGGEFIIRIFRNIIHTAVMVKEYGWLENFLIEYLPRISIDSRESMGNLGNALLHFEKGEFKESLGLLNKIDYELFHFKIDIKNLQLRLYYELGYIEELISAIDTYKHFISNNRFISERYKTLCSGFINNLNMVIRAGQNKYSRTDVDLLKKEIAGSGNKLYMDWLLRKVNDLN